MSAYLHDVRRTTPKALVACLMPVIILYGVYGGIFTPTEAGAVSVFVGIIISWVIFPLIFRSKAKDGFWRVIRQSALTSAAIMMIIAFAHPVSEMIAYTRISTALTDFIMEYTSSVAIFLLLVNILLLIVGMFMETNTSILLFAPILFPVAKAYGVDPIHFSAIFLLNLEIGMITPPFAVNLFAACRMSGISMDKVLMPLLPFLLACLVVLGITTCFPQIATYIVHLSH
jgi:C4-dicarboxylate transporter DctM subunit